MARPRRVFLSHTAELRRIPPGGSFFAAAEDAVQRAGDEVVAGEYFASRDLAPAEVSAEKVREADVFVSIVGFRYGPTVRDRPELSYCELELEVAERLFLPRLSFLLGPDTVGPRELFVDPQYGERQEAFRRRLRKKGTVLEVSAPAELGAALLQALLGLEPSDPESAPAPDRRSIDVFLSYGSGGAKRARELAGRLSAEGLTVWSDEKTAAGAGWQNETIEAMERAKAIVVVVGPESERSTWQRQEWMTALSRSWDGVKVIPVVLDDATPPAGLRAMRVLHLDGEVSEEAVETLVGAIKLGDETGLVDGSRAERLALLERLATFEPFLGGADEARDIG